MRHRPVIALLIIVLAGCGKKNGTTDNGPTTIPVPDKAVLTGPAANATCTVGRILSTTQSAVTFSWNAANNTESYELTVRDLLSGAITTQNTTATQLEVTLSRNTPYAWYITSRSTKTATTTQSDTWKFYNAGIAATNYAPFPADLTGPLFNQNVTVSAGKVTLTWAGSDVDNDIVGYDIYLGTTLANMAIVKSGQTTTSFDAAVTSGSLNYWKVVTKDGQGNVATSVTSQFTVN